MTKALHSRLEIKRLIKINAWFSAEDWSLYTGDSYPNAPVIANRLNRQLEDYVNRGETKSEVRRFMHSLMRQHAKDGANDTEPRAFLERILDELFGEGARLSRAHSR